MDDANLSSLLTGAAGEAERAAARAARVRKAAKGGAESIVEYLGTLDTKTSLYTDPLTSVSVFRLLPRLAQHVVMRLLWLEGGVDRTIVMSWVRKPSVQLMDQALSRLLALRILSDDGGGLVLEPDFRHSIQLHVRNGTVAADIGEMSVDKRAPSAEKLRAHSSGAWDRILQFLVDIKSHKTVVPPTTRAVLLQAGLIRGAGAAVGGADTLTTEGFRFLFRPHREQVWKFALSYVQLVVSRQRARPEVVLKLLFKLGHLKQGQDYAVKALDPAQQSLLPDLNEFGFVFRRKSSSKRYYSTSLSASLAAGRGGGEVGSFGSSQGPVIVETTFRLVAYTKSKFQVDIIAHFVRLDYRLPNVVIGVITKKSVKRALENGITAEGIIAYLEQYAHPRMERNAKSGSALPAKVVDQIIRWEQESNRCAIKEAVLLDDFKSMAEFAEIRDLLRRNGQLLWCSNAKVDLADKMISTTSKGEDVFRNFMSRKRGRKS